MGRPLFLNVRGNFIAEKYRNVVPYYSLDLGGTFRDGLMLRPSVGLRIGQSRSAFLIAIGYMAQGMGCKEYIDPDIVRKHNKLVSFFTLKLGYQF